MAKTKDEKIEGFRSGYLGIFQVLKNFEEIGISNEEITLFMKNLIHNEVMFSAKFYYSAQEECFKYETNFPKEFELFKQLLMLECKKC